MSNQRRQFPGLAAGAIAVPATSSLVVAQVKPSEPAYTVISYPGTLWAKGDEPHILRRLNMKANLKVILSVIGVAALLAAPAMAQKVGTVPSAARGSVAPYGVNEGGPYTPSIPTLPYGRNRDFQNGSRG